MSGLSQLREECLACRRCSIGGVEVCDGRLSNVFSNMNTHARLMVIGQNPGREEVRQGEPFVGPSGRFFDEAVEAVLGLRRSDLYICNVVRCYTPDNRSPTVAEIEECRPFLDREVELLNPRLIITLGGPALKQVTGMGGITKHHGQKIYSPRYKRHVLPLFHPSPLNTNNPERKQMFYEDLKVGAEILRDVQ